MRSSMPKISVIMSVYNEPLEWVAFSIDSILIQTFSDFEFIIVDDNPANINLLNFLHDYEVKDKRIKIIVNENNIGLTKSLNVALSHAQGEFIARMDADDISSKYRFQKQIQFLNEHPYVDICGSWAKKIGNIRFFDQKSFKLPLTHEEIVVGFVFSSQIVHPSVLARSNVLKMFTYDENLIKAQDYDLWVRMIIAGKIFANIPDKLLYYRVTAKSQSSKYTDLQESTADKSRRKLLCYLCHCKENKELEIHNTICNCKVGATYESALKWLTYLQKVLTAIFPQCERFVSEMINRQWYNFCSINKISYSNYKHSTLYRFSLNVFLRYLKTKLLKTV